MLNDENKTQEEDIKKFIESFEKDVFTNRNLDFMSSINKNNDEEDFMKTVDGLFDIIKKEELDMKTFLEQKILFSAIRLSMTVELKQIFHKREKDLIQTGKKFGDGFPESIPIDEITKRVSLIKDLTNILQYIKTEELRREGA